MQTNIPEILQKHLKLKSEPKIIFQKQRPKSFVYEFIGDNQGYFLKINQRNFEKNPSPKTRENIIYRGLEEWKSLNHFYDLTRNKTQVVRFVKPVAFIPEIGGVVTEKTDATDFRDLLKKPPSETEKQYNVRVLQKVGKAFAFLHEQGKTEKQEIQFKHKSVHNKKLDKLISGIFEKEKGKHSDWATKTMKGFQIRDVMVDQKGNIVFLDPGKYTEQLMFRIIGNYLANMKIIWQRDIIFPFKKPDIDYERALLDGYFNNSPYDKKLVGLFVLEELTILYSGARKKLDKKKVFKLLPILKCLFLGFYLNVFYYREIKNTICEYGFQGPDK